MALSSNGRILGKTAFILTTSFVFLGAFSRFTHGRFTPRYYAYQEYHRPDDGGLESRIIPVIDTVLGTMLLTRRTRLVAAVIVDIFMMLGLVMQVSAGKDFFGDVIMVFSATATVIQAWKM